MYVRTSVHVQITEQAALIKIPTCRAYKGLDNYQYMVVARARNSRKCEGIVLVCMYWMLVLVHGVHCAGPVQDTLLGTRITYHSICRGYCTVFS